MRPCAPLLSAVCLASTALAATSCSDSVHPTRPSASLVGAASIAAPSSTLPVFPGAQGFGATTPAGRGGQVIRVTNLNADGPGSLRAAVAAPGPRTIIFEVAGTIRLRSAITVKQPYMTVAGQTAPSPGVTLRGAGLDIESHDVLVQHLRIRVGDDPLGPRPSSRDGVQLSDAARNVVLDHLSVSWAVDENVGFSSLPGAATISNSIVSEGLNNSLHPDGAHSKGVLVSDRVKNVALIGNLLAHNQDRNAYFNGSTGLMVNNVIYDWGNKYATQIRDAAGTNLPSLIAIVGNVYLPGPSTEANHRPVIVASSVASGTKVYVADNRWARATSDPWSVVRNDAGAAVKASSPPVWVSPLTVRSSSSVESSVLSAAGARPAERDAVDARVVAETKSRTGRVIDSQRQVGGWVTVPMVTRRLTVPGTPDGDSDGDGYTNLEEWIHQFADQVEGP